MKIFEIYNDVLNDADNIFYHGSPYKFDKFDFSKIGSGDGLSKFGYGLYFTDDERTAIYYAKELSIGKLRETGFNLYLVSLRGLNEFYEWESPIPEEIHSSVIYKLNKMGKQRDAEQLQQEYEEYDTTFSLRSMYEYLEVVLESKAAVSTFLNIIGVNGAIADSPMTGGIIYVTYCDDIIRILDVKKIQ